MKYIAIYTSKIFGFILKNIFKKGTSAPGKIALRIDRKILSKVSKDRITILVTGTNGKTTTTSLIYNALVAEGHDVITNASGANLIAGITTCFIENFRLFYRTDIKRYAVIEIDEATMKGVCRQITPRYILITNLFRDQLDRYGEVYTTLNKIMEGVKLAPKATLILNADEPLLSHLDVDNRKVYYGFNDGRDATKNINLDGGFCQVCQKSYHYDFITYNHLGKYYCDCGHKRPELDYSVDKVSTLTATYSVATINGKEYRINQSGVYNIYNALSALAVCKEARVKEETLHHIFSTQKAKFGRQEIIEIGGKTLTIFLVKNPAGYNQTLDTIALTSTPYATLFMLNDNVADGTDVSWIWDVEIEKIKNFPITSFYISGVRRYDMATRLKIATQKEELFIIEENYEKLTQLLLEDPSDEIYALLTYTAMLSYRKFLQKKGYIKEYWR